MSLLSCITNLVLETSAWRTKYLTRTMNSLNVFEWIGEIMNTLHIYIYMCLYVCIYVCMCIRIYLHTNSYKLEYIQFIYITDSLNFNKGENLNLSTTSLLKLSKSYMCIINTQTGTTTNITFHYIHLQNSLITDWT